MATATKRRVKANAHNNGHRAAENNRRSADGGAWPLAPGETGAEFGGSTRMLLVSQLEPSPTNPRKYFDEAELERLAESIDKHGLLQPLLVRPQRDSVRADGKLLYEIICGERRFRAAKLLRGCGGLKCSIRDLSDAEVLELQLVENLQRGDLRPLEEARAFRTLLDAGMTQQHLAERLGCTQGHISNRVRLLELPEEVQADVNAGQLPATQARLIAPYAHVPKIVRAMRQFAHEHAKQSDGQAPSVPEWRHQLGRVVQRNTAALEGYGWRIMVTAANRDELQLVPAPYGNGKRAANVGLVKRLAGQKKRAKDKREKTSERPNQSRQRESWRIKSERRNRESLAAMIWQLAIARRLEQSGAETHLVHRVFIALAFDGDGVYGIDRKVFPKLKRSGAVWNELERIAGGQMTHVMARTLIEAFRDSHVGLDDTTLQSIAGHLGAKSLASAWGEARDSAWVKKHWARECKDCGRVAAGKEIPLECPEWLLPEVAAKKGKGKK